MAQAKWKTSKTSEQYNSRRTEGACRAVVFGGGYAGSKNPYQWYVQRNGADQGSGPARSATGAKKKANEAFAKCVARGPLAGARRKRRK